MARRDDVHEFVQNNCTKPKEDNKGGNDITINKDNKLIYVPENTALVYTTITGAVKVIVGPCFPKFNFPWRKGFEYIDLKEKTTDYKAREFHTKNYIKIQADLYVRTKVVNPRKFYLENQNFETTLLNFIQEKVMIYFQNITKEELDRKSEKISISQIGADKFREIEDKYGVEITSIGTTQFHYPDLLNDAKVQAENKMRHEENLRQQQRKAELQKENRNIQLFDAETNNMITANEYNNFATLIKGMSQEEISAIQELIKWKTIGQVNPESLTIIENPNQNLQKPRRRR